MASSPPNGRCRVTLWVSLLSSCVLARAAPGTSPATQPTTQPVHAVEIKAGDLLVHFRDNRDSPRILSGVDSLVNIKEARDQNAFGRNGSGASGGLNFEHIISGHNTPNNKFTPRHGKYSLHPLSDGRSVTLVRDATDDPWAVSSTMKYTVTAPHYIDFEFKCRFHDRGRFGKRGYALFFFTSYMHDVQDVALHCLGVDAPGAEEKWVALDAPPRHRDWDQGGNYRHARAVDLEYDDDVEFRLNHWTYDYPRFTQQFYYGLANKGMVYMLMFDRSFSPEDEIRFSLFKFKLKRFPRPAWDFEYVVHRVQEDEGLRLPRPGGLEKAHQSGGLSSRV